MQTCQFDPTMLNIGCHAQLFVDDLLIESVENIRRTWYQPHKDPASPVISRDRPWENITYTNCSDYKVIYDEQDGLFRCWYTDWTLPEVRSGEQACGNSMFNLLYAQSNDGVCWQKPALDLHCVDGRHTNIISADTHVAGVVFDPHAKKDARYKILFNPFMAGGDVAGLAVASSSDGVRWTRWGQSPQIGSHGSRLDDVAIVEYDPFGRVYYLNTRHYDMYAVARNLNTPMYNHWTPIVYPKDWSRQNRRRVWQCVSSDFIHWSEPRLILGPEDGFDGLDEVYYGMCQYREGALHLGLLTSFHQVENCQCVRLVYSRDGGATWSHLNRGQPFLAPSDDPEAWDSVSVQATSAPIRVGDELLFFHGGARCHHDWFITGKREGVRHPEATDKSLVNFGVGVARLRVDGYASLQCGFERPGIMVTRPFISDGTQLVINARCGKTGSIAVEVTDMQDRILPGFDRCSCDPFTADSIDHIIAWRGCTDIPVISNERSKYPEPEYDRLRKLRFYFDDAELFSFTLK